MALLVSEKKQEIKLHCNSDHHFFILLLLLLTLCVSQPPPLPRQVLVLHGYLAEGLGKGHLGGILGPSFVFHHSLKYLAFFN